ncbi:unnamed protein product [Orchesella dallaii]|uniref:Uncharacterized protein n=1 Tax=Orchesella dallaii TaxID=48710 RepID=A0ABP1PHF4_9HEXA
MRSNRIFIVKNLNHYTAEPPRHFRLEGAIPNGLNAGGSGLWGNAGEGDQVSHDASTGYFYNKGQSSDIYENTQAQIAAGWAPPPQNGWGH